MYFKKIPTSLQGGPGAGYVYYKDLNEYHPQLATQVKSMANNWYAPDNKSNYGNKLLAMAENERAKELNYLRDIFGVNIPAEFLESDSFDKNLISAINQIMQTKDVLKRHIIRLQSGQAKINTTAFFRKYISDA